jgi:hypothetical protein
MGEFHISLLQPLGKMRQLQGDQFTHDLGRDRVVGNDLHAGE